MRKPGRVGFGVPKICAPSDAVDGLGAKLSREPVQDLLAGPEQYIVTLPDMGENVAEIFEPMRCAHDVGVHDQRHDPGGTGRIIVELVELIDRAVVVFAGPVMLDQHHRNVVALLRVGDIDDRPRARLEQHGFVIEHPVAEVFVTFFGQEVWGLPGFGETGAEPAARILAGGRIGRPIARPRARTSPPPRWDRRPPR